MSGVAGIIHFDGAPVAVGDIEKMTAAMSYRGPDGIRHWQQDGVALGHCMLQTTAESLEEIQPLHSEDDRYILLMDGRLDNWEVLRQQLLLHGLRLRDRSDAELVMHAYLTWGLNCLPHIEGDFVFVIWDQREKKLHCIRDRMGNKLFHYYWNGKTLAFATDVKALLQLAWIPKIHNEGMLADYLLAHWCTRNETWWKDIYRMPAAHRLEVDGSGFNLTEYWQPGLNQLLNFKSDAEYFECYRALFIEAVRQSSRSHRDIAFEVSGGLDSSALFAVADHLHKSGTLAAPDIHGYTLSFPDDEAANELSYARAVGTHVGRTVHEIEPSQPSLEWLRAWAKDNGQFPPYPNASMLIGMREHARTKGSKALLVGIGGDEWLIAGRSYYAEEIRARRWQSLAQCWAADRHDFGLPQTFWFFLRFGLAPLLPRHLKKAIRSTFNSRQAFAQADMSWLSPEMQNLARHRRQEQISDPVNGFRQISQQSKWNMLLSPTNTLARESEEGMAALSGLELRWPFYNLSLAQFAFQSPDHIRVRGTTNKYVHRRAMEGLLPPLILNRETKADFTVTYRRYLAGMNEAFCSEIPGRRDAWLNEKKLMEMYRKTQSAPSWEGIPEWHLWGLFGCDAICV